jgi:hypothetical protein
MEMECQINNMISKIYKSNKAIWKAGSLKDKTKNEIQKEFDKQNKIKPSKFKRRLTPLEKAKKRIIKLKNHLVVS